MKNIGNDRKMGVIVPFQIERQRGISRFALSIALFAKRILDKYSALGMYGFDDAALVFLEKLVEEHKQDSDIKKQIEFTVKLMLLHQNRNRLSKDIISEKNAFQRSVTNHIMVNLNRLLSVDKRVYSELNQLSHNNVRLQEAYDKIVKLENHEKKLVFQVRNQQTIKPKTLQNSFYQMFQRLMSQNQIKLSSQMFKESVERKQFKQELNKLLEIQNFRTDVERHEFLHIMKHGTLEERREAMDILKSAVMEVTSQTIRKEERLKWFQEAMVYHEDSSQEKTIHHKFQSKLLKEITTREERMLRLVSAPITAANYWKKSTNYQALIYPKKEHTTSVERQLYVSQNQKQERELNQLKQILQRQQTIQVNDHKLFQEVQQQLGKQDQLVSQILNDQKQMKKPASIPSLSNTINRRLKEELHLDKLRFGVE